MSTKERRSLIEGLNTDLEMKQVGAAFVFGAKRKPEVMDDDKRPQAAQPTAAYDAAAVRQTQQPKQRILQ